MAFMNRIFHERAACSPTIAADHCYICHSLRLLHTTLIARGAHAVLVAESTPLWQFDRLAASDVIDLARSPRAPPTFSL